MALTEKRVRSLNVTKDQYFSDGDGLYLYVRKSGRKFWKFRFTFDGSDTTMSFGEYPEMSLKDARSKVKELREQLEEGIDPRSPEAKPEAAPTGPTFREVAEEWIERKSTQWKPTYVESVLQKLNSNLYPAFGNIPVADLTPKLILSEMHKIEMRGAIATAKRSLSLLKNILDYAYVVQYIDRNVAYGLEKGLATPPKVEHFAAATTPESASFIIRAVRNYQGAPIVRLATEFLMLTFVRPINVRKAMWKDIDLDKRIWTIPAEEMKTNVEHKVPLSNQAMAILAKAWEFRNDDGIVFPPVRRRKYAYLSENVFVNALRLSGVDANQSTAHGFRSMASSLLNDAGFNRDVIEKQLAHADRDSIRAIYNRAEYWDQRVELMQKWADMVDELAGQPAARI